jgi:hypothetical protein
MKVSVDVYRFPEHGSIALLSDGVHENIGRDIPGYLTTAPVSPPNVLVTELVRRAQENGHTHPTTLPLAHADDSSAILIRCP